MIINMLLRDKNAIITGTSRGLGKAIAEAFVNEGANVWLCARKPTPEFESFAEKLNETRSSDGGWVKTVYFDLSDPAARSEGVKSIIKEKIPIDILVNNAGVAFSGTLNMTSINKLKEVFEINYFAPIELMQLVSRQMIRQKSGVIINIASAGGVEAQEGYLAYGSSKASLIWATRSVGKELAPYGIRVNAIAPGLVKTDMGFYKNDEELEKTISRTAMKRMGTPEEISNAALYLASDMSSFMTGQVLQIDGGRT